MKDTVISNGISSDECRLTSIETVRVACITRYNQYRAGNDMTKALDDMRSEDERPKEVMKDV